MDAGREGIERAHETYSACAPEGLCSPAVVKYVSPTILVALCGYPAAAFHGV
jgi:hypothetical protein